MVELLPDFANLLNIIWNFIGVWSDITESFLEMFAEELDEAICRTEHIHARVGFT
jgi:hypothetical protein